MTLFIGKVPSIVVTRFGTTQVYKIFIYIITVFRIGQIPWLNSVHVFSA